MAEILVERMMFRVESGSLVILTEMDKATTQARAVIEQQALKGFDLQEGVDVHNCCICLEHCSKKFGEFIDLEDGQIQVSNVNRFGVQFIKKSIQTCNLW